MVDYFKILGLKNNAEVDDIKKAYRQKALQYHPDKNKMPGAAEHFIKISEAYSYLMDDDRRKSLQNNHKRQAYYNRKQALYEQWLKNDREKVRYQAQQQAASSYEKFESRVVGKMASWTSKLINFLILLVSFMVLFMPWIGYLQEDDPMKRISLVYVIILSVFGIILIVGTYKMTISKKGW